MESSGERHDPFDCEFDLDQRGVIELLVGEQNCPLCGCAYDEPRIIRKRDVVITLAVQCHCCGTGSLVTVEREPYPATWAHSELSAVERAFFAALRPIDDGDMRRMHRLIREHRGDLRELL